MRNINKTILGALILTFGLGLIACDGNSAKKTDNKSQQDENKVVIGGQTLEKGNITAKVFKKGTETGIAGAKVTFIVDGDILSIMNAIQSDKSYIGKDVSEEERKRIDDILTNSSQQLTAQLESCKDLLTDSNGIANCKAPLSFMTWKAEKVNVTVAKDTDLGINAIVKKQLDLKQSTNIDIEIQ